MSDSVNVPELYSLASSWRPHPGESRLGSKRAIGGTGPLCLEGGKGAIQVAERVTPQASQLVLRGFASHAPGHAGGHCQLQVYDAFGALQAFCPKTSRQLFANRHDHCADVMTDVPALVHTAVHCALSMPIAPR